MLNEADCTDKEQPDLEAWGDRVLGAEFEKHLSGLRWSERRGIKAPDTDHEQVDRNW